MRGIQSAKAFTRRQLLATAASLPLLALGAPTMAREEMFVDADMRPERNYRPGMARYTETGVMIPLHMSEPSLVMNLRTSSCLMESMGAPKDIQINSLSVPLGSFPVRISRFMPTGVIAYGSFPEMLLDSNSLGVDPDIVARVKQGFFDYEQGYFREIGNSRWITKPYQPLKPGDIEFLVTGSRPMTFSVSAEFV